MSRKTTTPRATRAPRLETQRQQHSRTVRLRAELERLQFTLDSIGDGLLTVDTQQRVTSINRAAQQLLGWQANEALGKELDQVFRLVNAKTRQAIANPVRLVLEQGCTVGLPTDTVLVAKDKSEYFVSSSIAPIYNHAARIAGAVLVFRDITRLRQAEHALKEAQQFAAGLIEHSLDMIIAVDQQRRIIEFNPAAERAFGYTKQEIMGQDASILYADPLESDQVRQTTSTTGSAILEVWNRRKNGEVFPALLSASQLRNAAGDIIGTMGVSREITNLKRAEEQRIRNERLAALGQMAAALAHEINNPLQAIQSTLDLILDFPLPDQEREQNLSIIRQEIERLGQITERILRFARPAPSPRRMTSLSDLLHQTLTLANKHLQHRHIHVTQEIQDTPPVLVSAEQIAQVFLNIILNAIEAAGENSHLCIATRVENNQVHVSFSNDGPSIPPEEIAHIFDPFFTSKQDGTGLGLHIAQTIVQQHNGSLTAENIGAERGVRFTIRLPLAMNWVEETV